MVTTSGERRGFALALAIAAMVVMGTLIAGIFFASTQEYRLGRNALLQARALTAAEHGLLAVATPPPTGRWEPLQFASLAPGATAPPLEVVPGDGSIDTVRVTRLDVASYLLVSEARAGAQQGARARRRIAALVRLRVPNVRPGGALTLRGRIALVDSSLIDGADSVPAGWSCPASNPPGSALIAGDSSAIDSSACRNPTCLLGSPPIAFTPSAADTSTYARFGDLDWHQLTTGATVLGSTPLAGIAPSFNGDGSCNVGDSRNWGDPTRGAGNAACQAYFPVLYAPGDLHFAGGVGQGLLLVHGNLELSGGAEFVGLVVVRGRLTTSGVGGKVTGGILVADTGSLHSALGGSSRVRFSTCAVGRALTGSARPARPAPGSWNELF
jgi:hypothetical protein